MIQPPGVPSLDGYVDRNAALLELAAGKSVLHLGCVGFTDCTPDEKVAQAPATLHAALSRVSRCVGVDLDAVTIQQLQARGVFDNVLVGDVEDLSCLRGHQPFEVVVAGDIIEHVSNPGRMLDQAREYLAPGGLLAVSTPNAYGLPAFLRMLAGRHSEGAQHVLNFNPITLAQLLTRHGYEVVRARSCFQQHARTSALFPVLSRALGRVPRLGGTLLFECRVASSWAAGPDA